MSAVGRTVTLLRTRRISPRIAPSLGWGPKVSWTSSRIERSLICASSSAIMRRVMSSVTVLRKNSSGSCCGEIRIVAVAS
jgi:hypothetical protein